MTDQPATPPSRFRRAERRAVNLRMAIDGPTGAGKTLTALLLARGIVGPGAPIALIDTEHGTAEKFYADRVEFDTLVLTEFLPAAYVNAINDAAAEGYPLLVIDSLSHAWEGVLAMVDAKGGEFGAWRHVTPHHNALVQALLTFPGHLIVTMRSKMAYEVTKNGDGKTAVSKLGLQPVQRAGLEYEFDLVADIDPAHQLAVTKSRVSSLADRVVPFANEEFGREVAEAISVGKPDVSARMARLLFLAGVGKRALVEALQGEGIPSSEALADAAAWENAQRIAQALRIGQHQPAAAAPAPAPDPDETSTPEERAAGEDGGDHTPPAPDGGAPATPAPEPQGDQGGNGAEPEGEREPTPAEENAEREAAGQQTLAPAAETPQDPPAAQDAHQPPDAAAAAEAPGEDAERPNLRELQLYELAALVAQLEEPAQGSKGATRADTRMLALKIQLQEHYGDAAQVRLGELLEGIGLPGVWPLFSDGVFAAAKAEVERDLAAHGIREAA